MPSEHPYTFLDKVCLNVDQILRALTNNVKTTGRPYPAKEVEEAQLSADQRQHAAALMRINHAGEICAQALYQGQSVTARTQATQQQMQQAAVQEGDHLAWCSWRLDELGSRTSYLNPIWYMGSFCIGALAGCLGDAWSYGFVAETERQVAHHLGGHLSLLPTLDQRSYAILRQMEADETEHRDAALSAGARNLPEIIKKAMALTSKIMVKTAYYF
jgi:ubiquinone biosynthesis monooxygenase Coq7